MSSYLEVAKKGLRDELESKNSTSSGGRGKENSVRSLPNTKMDIPHNFRFARNPESVPIHNFKVKERALLLLNIEDLVGILPKEDLENPKLEIFLNFALKNRYTLFTMGKDVYFDTGSMILDFQSYIKFGVDLV